ncbi:hypothetical protein [uncultured Paraglaciecola sp.]|uniref:hypothetical protein n=1 Tax=uncultured Paraglaciecola sp. TaxID=1765024 RepID=UPI0026140FEF|nr:hypothetical protein [uncultured Paraglaciecola sp.]
MTLTFHEGDVCQHKLKPINSVTGIIRKVYWVTVFMELKKTKQDSSNYKNNAVKIPAAHPNRGEFGQGENGCNLYYIRAKTARTSEDSKLEFRTLQVLHNEG